MTQKKMGKPKRARSAARMKPRHLAPQTSLSSAGERVDVRVSPCHYGRHVRSVQQSGQKGGQHAEEVLPR